LIRRLPTGSPSRVCPSISRLPSTLDSSADFLAHEGVPTFIDAQHAIAHNKIMIIDGEVVLTGSFNFTKAAEAKNAENLLVLHDSALSSKYEANWQLHLNHSTRYWGR
jgi:phosphatidylserine/phosphatidylglycerophosphate/cardiolipin synthase-like enzyme